MVKSIFLIFVISFVCSCNSTIDFDVDAPEETAGAPLGPPIDLSTSSILWSTSNPYYTMLGAPDNGGRSNDLWISDGTEAGSAVLKVNPDDGRKIGNCAPQDLANFDGGANIHASRYDLDNDGNFDTVEILKINSDFTYTVLANINKQAADQDLECYYTSMVGSTKLFFITTSGGATNYSHLWRTDGTVAGTYDLGGGNNGGFGQRISEGPYVIGNHAYFFVEDNYGSQNPTLVRTDGSSFEVVNIPGIAYPWGEYTNTQISNRHIYIWFETSQKLVHIDTSENINVYTGGAGSHGNVDYIQTNFFSDSANNIFLKSTNSTLYNHQYVNKADGKYYPVPAALMLPNIPFMVNDTGVYFYEDLGAGNFEIKKSTDMTTLTTIGTVALPTYPHPYMTKFDNRYLVFATGGEQYIFDVDNAALYSPTFVSNCTESQFSNVAVLGANSKVRETENLYYACTAAPNAAFARYNLTTHTTEVFVELDMMVEMSNEYKAMAFVQTFLMNYFNVIAFYNINDGQVIGATAFQ